MSVKPPKLKTEDVVSASDVKMNVFYYSAKNVNDVLELAQNLLNVVNNTIDLAYFDIEKTIYKQIYKDLRSNVDKLDGLLDLYLSSDLIV